MQPLPSLPVEEGIELRYDWEHRLMPKSICILFLPPRGRQVGASSNLFSLFSFLVLSLACVLLLILYIIIIIIFKI